MMDLQEAALATDGTAVGGNVYFQSVSTDSRAIQSGQLFVALRGDRFDGHEFVTALAAQGAVAAMVAVGRASGASGASAVLPSGKIPCCPKISSSNALRMAKMPDVARFGGCFC